MDEIKILCVDDEKNVLRSLRRVFLDEDFELLTADSGEEGLEVIDSNPDLLLIISDYRMPGMNGVDFLKEAFKRIPDTIRIVLSGYADTASVVAAINEGQIYKFIPKPWNDDELVLTIKEAIDVYHLRQKNKRLADQLMELNEDLEEQVAIRTTELEFQITVMSFSHNVMNALPVALLGMTPGGLIVMGNKLSEVLFSTEAQSLVGEDWKDIFPEDLQMVVSSIVENGNAEQEVIINNKVFRVRGKQIPQEHEQEGIVLMLDPK